MEKNRREAFSSESFIFQIQYDFLFLWIENGNL